MERSLSIPASRVYRWLLSILLLFSAELAFARPLVSVRAKVSVERAQVYLGDLARFRGFSEEEKRRAAAHLIGPAPMGGSTQRLSRPFLEAKLRDAPLPARVRLKIPATVTLERALVQLGAADLQARVEEVARETLGPTVRLRGVRLLSPRPLSYPKGSEISLQLIPVSAPRAMRSVALKILDDGRTIGAKQLRVELLEEVDALCVDAPLLPGRPLEPRMIKTITRLAHELPRDALLSRGELLGAIAKQRVPAKVPLRQAWFRIPPMIVRGSEVQMIYEGNGISLTAIGQALGDGSKGDIIRVRNLQSRKIVSGRVSAPNVVKMEF